MTFELSKAEAGAIGSILAAGLIVGGIIMGGVADRIGRVRALYLSILIYSVFTCLTAFAPSATWVAVSRFLGGLGMGGTWTAGAALVAETWGAKHRGKGGALMQMGLPIGSMLAIAVTALISNLMAGLNGNGWRVIYGLGCLPALLLLPIAWTTPESPAWRPPSSLRPGDRRHPVLSGNTRNRDQLRTGGLARRNSTAWLKKPHCRKR